MAVFYFCFPKADASTIKDKLELEISWISFKDFVLGCLIIYKPFGLDSQLKLRV